jgi:hypothetical protein
VTSNKFLGKTDENG